MSRHPRLTLLLALLSLVAAGVWAPRAAAQPAVQQLGRPGTPAQVSPGLIQAQAFVNRMARIAVVRVDGQTPEEAFGFVAGELAVPGGGTTVLLVTADHFIREPARGGAAPQRISVLIYGDLGHVRPATLLEQRLPPALGDLAVLAVALPTGSGLSPARYMEGHDFVPGSLMWQVGRPGSWQPAAIAGRFSLYDPKGWLTIDGLEAVRGAAGGAVLGARGLAGMMVSDQPEPGGISRVVPADVLAAKFQEWGLPWGLALPEGSTQAPGTASIAGATGSAAPSLTGQATAAMPAPVDAGPSPGRAQGGAQTAGISPGPARLGPPIAMVPISGTELQARGAWFPPGARVSPWYRRGAVLWAAPRKESTPVSTIPAGRNLPRLVWQSGAYEITQKLDGGAWFLVATAGQVLGYVAGNDLVELWPVPPDPAQAGSVVREWGPAPLRAVLRDAKTHYDLSAVVTCKREYCSTVQVYTPEPPADGAVVPTFHVPRIDGSWQQKASIRLHVWLPRRVVESKGVRLMACVGRDADCDEQPMLVEGDK